MVGDGGGVAEDGDSCRKRQEGGRNELVVCCGGGGQIWEGGDGGERMTDLRYRDMVREWVAEKGRRGNEREKEKEKKQRGKIRICIWCRYCVCFFVFSYQKYQRVVLVLLSQFWTWCSNFLRSVLLLCSFGFVVQGR